MWPTFLRNFSTVLMELRSHIAVYDEKSNKLIPFPVVLLSFPVQQLAHVRVNKANEALSVMVAKQHERKYTLKINQANQIAVLKSTKCHTKMRTTFKLCLGQSQGREKKREKREGKNFKQSQPPTITNLWLWFFFIHILSID